MTRKSSKILRHMWVTALTLFAVTSSAASVESPPTGNASCELDPQIGALRCVFETSELPAAALPGVPDNVPVYVEAWSGPRSDGSVGYAATGITAGELARAPYIYVDSASSKLSSAALTEPVTPSEASAAGVVALAGSEEWARQPVVPMDHAPLLGRNQVPADGAGRVALTFDVCAVDQPAFGFCTVPVKLLNVAQKDDTVWLAILGNPGFDAEEIDPATLRSEATGAGPTAIQMEGRLDPNGDGQPDFIAVFRTVDGSEQHCVRGTSGRARFRGCVAARQDIDSPSLER